MRTHTNDFKNAIKTFGRQQEIQIIYTIDDTTTTLISENINNINLTFSGNILKSIMRELIIDSNINIPLETEITFKYGIKVGSSFEYLNYGHFIVKEMEKQEDTSSYLLKCYDKMLYSMIDYEDMNITYPITIRNYINAICTKLGLTFKNVNSTFVNYNKEIQNELFLTEDGGSYGYTFRDVLDQLAGATASTICINEDDDELEIRYINNTNDTINEEFLKDINVKFGEKFGPINSIVLSRSAESDNVYLADEQSITQNGLCEIKIVDNQIMNYNDRSEYLTGILNQLNGLEYYINDFSSTGICYYDVCDKYNINIDNNVYSCIMFNDEIQITQGLEEDVYVEMPEDSITDYSKADKTDIRLNQAYLIVNKNTQEIQSLVSNIDSNYYNNEQIDAMFGDTNGNMQVIQENLTRTTQNATQVQIEVENILQNGVNKVQTTMGYTFDNEGLKINKTNAETETSIDESAIKVVDKTGNTENDLLYAGYVKSDNTNYSSYAGQTIVYSKNMIVQNYLVVPNSRFETYENPILGGHGTGVFGI